MNTTVAVLLAGPAATLVGVVVNAIFAQTRWSKVKTKLEVAKAFKDMGREARAERMTDEAEQQADSLEAEPSWIARVWNRAWFPMLLAYHVGGIVAALGNRSMLPGWLGWSGLFMAANSAFLTLHTWNWKRTTLRDRGWIDEAAAAATLRANEISALAVVAASELKSLAPSDAEARVVLREHSAELKRLEKRLQSEAKELRARAADVRAFEAVVGLVRRARTALAF